MNKKVQILLSWSKNN